MHDSKKSLLPAKRILVMRYRFIGDTILAVPFLRNLRAAYPDAVIDVLVGPESGKVLEGCPYVNELIPYDTTKFHKYDRGQGKPRSLLSYAMELRKRKYDTCFVLKRSLSSAILSVLIGAKYRIGYGTQGRSFLLTHQFPFRTDIHEVESVLDALRAVHIPIGDKSLEAWTSVEEQRQLSEIAPAVDKAGSTKILVHAAAAHPDKMYPIADWAKVMQQLRARHQDATFFFTGAERDFELYEELQKLAQIEGVNLAGKLSLRLSIALLQKMHVAACVDSGPAHLGAAAGIPVVAVFGPTDPVRWGPWGEHHTTVTRDMSCRPCNYKKSCDDRRECLTQLDPSQIADACTRKLEKCLTPMN
jgi:heptosyltransferase-2